MCFKSDSFASLTALRNCFETHIADGAVFYVDGLFKSVEEFCERFYGVGKILYC